MSVDREKNHVEMEEEAEYQRQLALFINASTEKGIELVKIGEVLAGIPRRSSFLDIGAGGGYMTIPISQSFDETTVVEPNEKQAIYLHKRCPRFKIFNDSWDNVDLQAEKFDFILCSHVLYYIAEGNWVKTIDKMFSHLEEGGRMVIVLQSPIGEVADFFNRFTRYDVNILKLWADLIRQYGDEQVEVRYFLNEIWTESLEDMGDIGLFLLIDRRFRPKKEEICRYMDSHHKADPGYRLTQDEIVIIVKRSVPDRT